MDNNQSKTYLLKESLRIVDKLASIEDIENEIDLIEDLVLKSQKLKKHRLWKL